MTSLLQVEDLHAYYGKSHILQGVGFVVGEGEVLSLLREGLQGARRVSNVCEIHGEFLAIDKALQGLQAGDLCLILVDQVEEALTHIARRIAETAS